MISVRNITKSFGSQVVLRNVSVEIEPGKTTAVVGPSGVGKSVLLKLIMGILEPDTGEILVCDRSITAARDEAERNDIRSNLGVLFQSAALFDSLTLYENIAFSLENRTTLSKNEIHEQVADIMKSLSLIKFAHRYPEQVSMGIRKRVGMARALINKPRVFLLDEPNTGLDPLVGQEVYDLINECRDKWGFAGVVISHELPEVFQVSDKVVMLLGGTVIIEGTPEELVASADPAVQQFLNGNANGPIKIQ